MKRFLIKVISAFNEKIGIISSFLVLLLIFLVSLSVILRYVFSIGFVWVQDLYFLLYRNFNKKKKKVINIIGLVIFGIPLTYLLLVNGLDYFMRSFNLNEGSKESGGLPNIFILKFFIIFLGILLFLEIFRQIISFLKK